MLGETNVGKTSILTKIKLNEFKVNFCSTVGVDYVDYKVKI